MYSVTHCAQGTTREQRRNLRQVLKCTFSEVLVFNFEILELLQDVGAGTASHGSDSVNLKYQKNDNKTRIHPRSFKLLVGCKVLTHSSEFLMCCRALAISAVNEELEEPCTKKVKRQTLEGSFTSLGKSNFQEPLIKKRKYKKTSPTTRIINKMSRGLLMDFFKRFYVWLLRNFFIFISPFQGTWPPLNNFFLAEPHGYFFGSGLAWIWGMDQVASNVNAKITTDWSWSSIHGPGCSNHCSDGGYNIQAGPDHGDYGTGLHVSQELWEEWFFGQVRIMIGQQFLGSLNELHGCHSKSSLFELGHDFAH